MAKTNGFGLKWTNPYKENEVYCLGSARCYAKSIVSRVIIHQSMMFWWTLKRLYLLLWVYSMIGGRGDCCSLHLLIFVQIVSEIIKQSTYSLMVLETIQPSLEAFPWQRSVRGTNRVQNYFVYTVFTSEHKTRFCIKLRHGRATLWHGRPSMFSQHYVLQKTKGSGWRWNRVGLGRQSCSWTLCMQPLCILAYINVID